jgi:hypothetical protein
MKLVTEEQRLNEYRRKRKARNRRKGQIAKASRRCNRR